jgi:hypothetical protein
MTNSIQTQLNFHPVDGLSVRANFDGGAMSSDFGAILMRETALNSLLLTKLAAAISDPRRQSHIKHSLQDLITQRCIQLACGYEDANDSNSLRKDPMFKLAIGKKPLDEEQDLAHASTFTRLGQRVDKKDLYRMAQAFIEHFMDSYHKEPKIIILDMDHTEDQAYGQQELILFNRYYGHLPLTIFEGFSGKLIGTYLRPGKRPTGAENAMIMKRVIQQIRGRWSKVHIILRGDGHFSNPELMQLSQEDDNMDFIFGVPGNKALSPLSQGLLDEAQHSLDEKSYNAKLAGQSMPFKVRLYDKLDYKAKRWEGIDCRLIVKAEVNQLGRNPRYVVTSIPNASAKTIYCEFYCARGEDENFIKQLKNDMACDRTSDHGFLANQLRLFYSAAAYVLMHEFRSETLKGTSLERAEMGTIRLKLFKIAVRVVQYKDRVKLLLPSSCPVSELLKRVTDILYYSRLPKPG